MAIPLRLEARPTARRLGFSVVLGLGLTGCLAPGAHHGVDKVDEPRSGLSAEQQSVLAAARIEQAERARQVGRVALEGRRAVLTASIEGWRRERAQLGAAPDASVPDRPGVEVRALQLESWQAEQATVTELLDGMAPDGAPGEAPHDPTCGRATAGQLCLRCQRAVSWLDAALDEGALQPAWFTEGEPPRPGPRQDVLAALSAFDAFERDEIARRLSEEVAGELELSDAERIAWEPRLAPVAGVLADAALGVRTGVAHDRYGPVKVRRVYRSLSARPARDWVLAHLVVDDRAAEDAVLNAIDAVAADLTALEFEPRSLSPRP